MRTALGILGIGALPTAGVAALLTLIVLALLVAPALVALAWNALDFGEGDTLRYEQAGHVVTLTYDRPEQHNAVNRTMNRELHHAWQRFRDAGV